MEGSWLLNSLLHLLLLLKQLFLHPAVILGTLVNRIQGRCGFNTLGINYKL
jgi:hypothetical protein